MFLVFHIDKLIILFLLVFQLQNFFSF